ncbi:MAG: peptidylprolyl isomerase [Methanotrichaceae archaeon]
MAVKNGDFIKIDYTESVDGQVIATTDESLAKEKGIYDQEIQYGPHLIVVGAGQLVKGFEDDLIGKEIGYSGHIEIPPEKAFGTHDPEKTETVPITRFKEEKPVVGMRVGIEGKYGTVTRIIGRRVTIDFNHPLADKTIVYDYRIVEAVEDLQEKLKSLIKTFARVDLESKIEDNKAIITVPWEMSYYKEWFMIRRGLADMIIKHLGLNEVDYVEKHTGEKVKAELISPPKKEGETEAAGEAEPIEKSAETPAEQGSQESTRA